MTACKLCGAPKRDWQVFCGAACCVAWESGVRTKDELDRIVGGAPGGVLENPSKPSET